jgi:hypothetical protein
MAINECQWYIFTLKTFKFTNESPKSRQCWKHENMISHSTFYSILWVLKPNNDISGFSNVYFTCYLLKGAFVSSELVLCPRFLRSITWDFFCIIFLFMSSIGGHLYTLLLFFSFTCGFFNIFRQMLLAPLLRRTKLIFLDVVSKIITISSS